MTKYQHIIWDWNGTLLDDSWLCVEIMNGELAKRGLPQLTIQRYQQIFRFPVIDYYRELGYDFEREPFETISNSFMDTYIRRWHECPLCPGALQTLELIKQKGIEQSILSAAEQKTVEGMVDHFGLRAYFIAVLGIEDQHAHGKLARGEYWMQQLRLPPESILMVGDTLHDYQIAQKLGIDCVLLTSGHQSRERLENSSAPVYNSLEEIEI